MPLKQMNIKGIKHRPSAKKSLKTQIWRSVFRGFKKNVDFTIRDGIIISRLYNSKCFLVNIGVLFRKLCMSELIRFILCSPKRKGNKQNEAIKLSTICGYLRK